MKYISWLITLPLLILGVVFALANRQVVDLSLWPLDSAVEVPLYLAVLVPLVIGYLLGGIAVWLGAGGKRRLARREHRELEQIKQETARQQQTTPASGPALADKSATPALGHASS
ncbi:LapA family protein [Rhodovibrionaceae bacterium A322]